jgi:hypothetical protein
VHKFHVQPFKIAPVAGAKVIQHPDGGAPVKMFRQMAPDKSGTTCDQDSHSLKLFCAQAITIPPPQLFGGNRCQDFTPIGPHPEQQGLNQGQPFYK